MNIHDCINELCCATPGVHNKRTLFSNMPDFWFCLSVLSENTLKHTTKNTLKQNQKSGMLEKSFVVNKNDYIDYITTHYIVSCVVRCVV